MKVLLADGDSDLVGLLNYALRRRGYNVLTVVTAAQAVQRVVSDGLDMVLLGSMLPDASGYETCQRIRGVSQIPIIMMNGSDREEDLIQGYEAGADDYLIKPFGIPHLLIRLETLMRRVNTNALTTVGRDSRYIQVADLVIDSLGFSARKNGSKLRLTRLEFRILHHLAENVGALVDAARLADFARGTPIGGDVELLKTHVSHIRQKLAGAGGKALRIRAVPRTGYILSIDDASAAVPAITASQQSA